MAWGTFRDISASYEAIIFFNFDKILFGWFEALTPLFWYYKIHNNKKTDSEIAENWVELIQKCLKAIGKYFIDLNTLIPFSIAS